MSEKYYLKQNVALEPLVNRWYAWTHLISPLTASMNLVNNHFEIMKSFIKDPESHEKAVASTHMKGGPFVDYPAEKVGEIKALLKSMLLNSKQNIELAKAIKKADALLKEKADGYDLSHLYNELPKVLQGCVELVYDLNNQACLRFFENMFYKTGYYDETKQEIFLYLSEDDDRTFSLSTPRLNEPGKLLLSIPFRDSRIDDFSRMKDIPQEFESICSKMNVPEDSRELFKTFFTTEAPIRREPYTGSGLRTRYFGHACVLLESKDISILTDPVISYYYDNELERYTYLDLPEVIDYVLISHNHQDHILFETLLQLRHKIKNIIIPKGYNCSLQDPSLKMIFDNLGFENVIELEELGEIDFGGGKIIGLPFLGEHADLDIRTKLGYMVRMNSQSFLFLSDSKNHSHPLYEKIHNLYGDVDITFIGMECEGAPLSWLYGPLLTAPLKREMDQSRRLSGSNFNEAYNIVSQFNSKHVYVYAMGQEPWLDYIMAIEYTSESYAIIESDKLINKCLDEGLVAERLYGMKEILLENKELPATNGFVPVNKLLEDLNKIPSSEDLEQLKHNLQQLQNSNAYVRIKNTSDGNNGIGWISIKLKNNIGVLQHSNYFNNETDYNILDASLKELSQKKNLSCIIYNTTSEEEGKCFEHSNWEKTNVYNFFSLDKKDIEKIDVLSESELTDQYTLTVHSRVPKDDLEGFIDLFNKLMKKMPSRGSIVEQITIEDHLLFESNLDANNKDYRVALLKKGNQLIGVSNLFFHKETMEAYQFMTGVDSGFEGNGYGFLMKKNVLKKLKEENIILSKIRSKVSIYNKPMLAVNTKLGYEKNDIESEFMLKIL